MPDYPKVTVPQYWKKSFTIDGVSKTTSINVDNYMIINLKLITKFFFKKCLEDNNIPKKYVQKIVNIFLSLSSSLPSAKNGDIV